MAPPSKLARLSRVMSVLSLLGMIVIPALIIAIFLHPDTAQSLVLRLDHLGTELSSQIPLQYRVDALACEAVPLGFTVWAMWSLRQLFANYARGEVFSPEPLRHLNNVANALFLGVLAEFVMEAPISYLLTWHLGPASSRNLAELRFERCSVAVHRRNGACHRARHGRSAPRGR